MKILQPEFYRQQSVFTVNIGLQNTSAWTVQNF